MGAYKSYRITTNFSLTLVNYTLQIFYLFLSLISVLLFSLMLLSPVRYFLYLCYFGDHYSDLEFFIDFKFKRTH